MAEAGDSDLIISKRKPINTLLPYAIYLEQCGEPGMISVILRAANASNSATSNPGKFMWPQVVYYISRLFETRSSTSLDRVIVLISPHVPWAGMLYSTIAVARWAAAASVVPYTEEVGSSVADALFQIALVDFLRPHIPINTWGWLKRHPSLPPISHALSKEGSERVILYLRRLGDIDILKSCFLLVWVDRFTPDSEVTRAMEDSIREDFRGTEAEQHRKDLTERLDHVLGLVDQRLESSPNDSPLQEAKRRYTRLKNALLEAGMQ
jgi:hypothetical protein